LSYLAADATAVQCYEIGCLNLQPPLDSHCSAHVISPHKYL